MSVKVQPESAQILVFGYIIPFTLFMRCSNKPYPGPNSPHQGSLLLLLLEIDLFSSEGYYTDPTVVRVTV
ncbi:hypothetical protein J6590_067446 [Homalodisca vitripennis]|nr:hypothetical protein J6590_067446 [Homalodisca vitripennis]